jgi:M6 family metalloprotease-like protein
LTFVVAPAAARPPYPDPPPDFTHADKPHTPLYSTKGGTTDRPMLVIYGRISGVKPSPPGVSDPDAAWAATRFFGGFPSVADYFSKGSFGNLQLTPAAESDTKDDGAVNDGVVVVNLPSDFFSKSPSIEAQVRDALKAAADDPGVDLSVFDRDRDGRIAQDELVAHFFFGGREFRDCAVARPTAPGPKLDGKNVDGLLMPIEGTDTTNLMTEIHETGHVVFDMPDLYDFVDSFDIAGATCGPGDESLFRTGAFQAMHLGWTVPTVVVEDGFYEVDRADRAPGESFILYDPAQGIERFYIVENRVRENGTYDQGAGDSGLVIWRFNDADYDRWLKGDATAKPVALRSPNGGLAWDPSDPDTRAQRTFEDEAATFPDVAVRTISARGDVMRVFFDVRGPGVLVDPNTDEGRPVQVNVTPERPNRVSFPVQNTGETTDTFVATVGRLPQGWTATTTRLALGPGESAIASVDVTPPSNAPAGIVRGFAIGRSESDPRVVSAAPLRLNVSGGACGEVITADTKLNHDLDCSGDGLVIGADNITLDLNGHTIDGAGTGDGVDNGAGHDGVAVRNGSIKEFNRGVFLDGASGNRLEGLTVSDNFIGISLRAPGNNRLDRNVVSGSGSDSDSDGIQLVGSSSNQLVGNKVSEHFIGISILSGANNTLEDNTASDNRLEGISVDTRTQLVDNKALRNRFSGIVLDGDQNRLEDNEASDNGFNGIEVNSFSDRNRLEGNEASGNNVNGIDLGGDNHRLLLNEASDNRGNGIALLGSNNNRLRRNDASGNRFDGILLSLSSSNRLEANTASDNGDYGIELRASSTDNRLEGNEASGNRREGILLSSSNSNRLERNRAADNDDDGILVSGGSSGTLLLRNRAHRNDDDGIDVNSASATLTQNRANRNGDLGIEAVPGVTDGGGNAAAGNGDPRQCLNVACSP